jgi:hypothetical protein
MEEIGCPYCDATLSIDAWLSTDESALYRETCSNCGKHFCYTVEFETIRHISPQIAGCLNDGPHELDIDYDAEGEFYCYSCDKTFTKKEIEDQNFKYVEA